MDYNDTMAIKYDTTIQNLRYALMFGFSFFLLTIGLVANSGPELLEGMQRILVSPSNLITDYIQVGNFGSAFLNSGLLTLLSILTLRVAVVPLNGMVIAAIFTVSGYSFFGKNLFNSIPIILGGILYAHLTKQPFAKIAAICLFGSSLSPVISYLAFGLKLPLIIGIPLGYLVGLMIGLILPPLALHIVHFHQGFSLYNVGFSAGLLAMILASILRMFGNEVIDRSVLSTSAHLDLRNFLLIFFIGNFIIGFILNNGSFKGLRKIFRSSGQLPTDFVSMTTIGCTLINMSLMVFLLLGYTQLIHVQLNGPIVGAILSAVGFSALGNHAKNSFPILLGVYLASFFAPLHEIQRTSVVLAAIFGTSLAPISGYYGFQYGILAGFFHLSLVGNINGLHGGLNLYNNGFSSGFVAAFMVPIINSFKKYTQRTKKT